MLSPAACPDVDLHAPGRPGECSPPSRLLHLALLVTWLIASVCLSTVARAQYGFDHWMVEDGLPQNLIRGIAQTPDGYLWIATLDGLVRFDGVRFVLFNKSNTPSITSNQFGSMYSGKDGSLWLDNGAEGGLTRYRHGAFHAYGAVDRIPGSLVNALTGDDAGNLWILSSNRIARWDEAAARFFDVTPHGVSLRYQSFLWDNAGFWAVDTTSLHCFIDGHFRTYPLPRWLIAATIQNAALDQSGAVWLQAADGRETRITADGVDHPVKANASPTVTYIGHHGQVWTMRLDRYLNRTLEFVSSGRTMSIPVRRFYEDRQQNLWLGTEGEGLYRLQGQSIHVYSKEQGLVDRDVYAIYQDRAGAVWIGAWHTGVSRFDGRRFVNYTAADGFSLPLVTALYQDRSGRFWVGSHGGLRVFEHGRFRAPPEPALPAGALVQAMYQDREGALWFGTTEGLVRLKDGATQVFTPRDGIAARDIHVIVEGASGDLWIGGSGGLTRLRNGHFTRWTEHDGLPSNTIWSLYEDSAGVLWIGTYDGGLARFQNGRFTRYSIRDGLFSEGVFQILEDAHGFFWISCNRGIYRVSKRELNEFAAGKRDRVTSVAYGKIDGLLDLECNGGIWPAGTKTRDGRLWFPTQDGAAVIDPNNILIDRQPPPVVIESSLLDRVPMPVTSPMRIPPGKDNLEIQYTALSFIKADQTRFRYKLTGLDTNWVDAGSRRTAYYSHLPPGKYVFQVIAENSDSVWNFQGQSLAITVNAPYYETWWFALLAAFVFLALLALAWRYRVSQLERKQALQHAFSQQLIASQEGERKRIAAELHDSLGQRLVVINNLALFSLRALAKTGSPDTHAQMIEEISSEAGLAIQETREISYNLRPFQLDRLGLSKAIEGIIRSVSKSSGIHFYSELDNIDDLFPEEMNINLYRIVQESINNILRHADATEVRIRIERSKERMLLTIHDNGRGFAPGVRSAKAALGGFGLTGMAERAHLLGGEFKVRSGFGHGTMIAVEVPLGGNGLTDSGTVVVPGDDDDAG